MNWSDGWGGPGIGGWGGAGVLKLRCSVRSATRAAARALCKATHATTATAVAHTHQDLATYTVDVTADKKVNNVTLFIPT